jgi:hypothetical protein
MRGVGPGGGPPDRRVGIALQHPAERLGRPLALDAPEAADGLDPYRRVLVAQRRRQRGSSPGILGPTKGQGGPSADDRVGVLGEEATQFRNRPIVLPLAETAHARQSRRARAGIRWRCRAHRRR